MCILGLKNALNFAPKRPIVYVSGRCGVVPWVFLCNLGNLWGQFEPPPTHVPALVTFLYGILGKKRLFFGPKDYALLKKKGTF